MVMGLTAGQAFVCFGGIVAAALFFAVVWGLMAMAGRLDDADGTRG